MTADQIVYNGLSNSGVPVARLFWGPNAEPDGPYATYTTREGGESYGDNATMRMPWYETTLFMSEWDEALVDRYEECVSLLGTYSREDAWSDGHFTATWRFTLLRKVG